MEKPFQIVTYSPRYQEAFIRLNTEWIKKYFELEESDFKVFEHPEQIVEKGGQIFFALTDSGIAVGCCALVRHADNHTYELAKMAVSPQYRGYRIGTALGHALMNYAKQKGIKSIFLEGNTRLKASIALYRRLGFQEIPLTAHAYKRCDILMKAQL